MALYTSHVGNELSAACTATNPPPPRTYSSNAVFVSAGHSAAPWPKLLTTTA